MMKKRRGLGSAAADPPLHQPRPSPPRFAPAPGSRARPRPQTNYLFWSRPGPWPRPLLWLGSCPAPPLATFPRARLKFRLRPRPRLLPSLSDSARTAAAPRGRVSPVSQRRGELVTGAGAGPPPPPPRQGRRWSSPFPSASELRPHTRVGGGAAPVSQHGDPGRWTPRG